MRKVFSCIVLFFAGFLAFSETGYNGVQWKSSVEQVANKAIVIFEPIEKKLSTISDFEDLFSVNYSLIANKLILGKETNISYFFEDEKLSRISYEFDKKDLKTLLKKYKTKPIIYRADKSTDLSIFSTTDKGSIFDILNPNKDEELNKELSSYIAKYSLSITSEFIERDSFNSEWLKDFNLTQEKIKNPAGTLYIYDYNSDTRVYIYDNIIKDKAVVVYVPHEQDY